MMEQAAEAEKERLAIGGTTRGKGDGDRAWSPAIDQVVIGGREAIYTYGGDK